MTNKVKVSKNVKIRFNKKMERETGLKPATSALARQRSIN